MSRRSEPGASDPVALRSPRLCRFFTGVMERQMRRAFRAIRIARPGLPPLPPDRPLMIYANHPSWWDPAFFIVLMRLFPDREGYGPMDAAMLERYRFMRRIGIFGVSQDDPRGGAEFLRTALRIASDARRILWITAPGEFADARARPVALRAGPGRLLARLPRMVAVPLALEYPFWTEKRPEALAMFGAPVEHREGECAAARNARLTGALEATMDALADRAMQRDAAAFERLIDGTAGIGGAYAAWGRLRAALKGRRYAADHADGA